MSKPFPLFLTTATTRLKRLIAENPDLPIVVLAEKDTSLDNGYAYCGNVKFEITEILDAEVPYQDEVETDRVHFEEQIEEYLWEQMGGVFEDTEPDEDVFDNALRKEKSKYEPYWKKVIVIYAAF